jgi:hypothetical protein
METKVHDFTIKADTAPLLEALSILSDFLHAGEVPLQFLDRVLDLLDALANSAGSRVSPQLGQV